MSISQISKKQLKAIVFTDIVNFTKISADDEHHALELINKQREILRPIVLKHNGEWLKELGDGLLFSFNSSLEAIRCSIEIQTILKDIEDFNIRIGFHQGDILLTDGDVYGDDVNIASRVESFAPEGGIAISDKISKDISGVKDIKTSFVGYRKLKGVEQETQIKSITSHSMPHHKISIFPKLAYYFSFTFGLTMLVVTVAIGSVVALRGGMSFDLMYDLINMSSNTIIFFLLGYTCLSYVKGISQKAQKFAVYFTYFYTCFFAMDEFIIPYLFEDITDYRLDMILLLSMLSISIILAIIKFKKK